jgi:site-specific DNA-methyltransferase (adenine-specific)
MCGDSTDENDVSRLMAGEKADMVYTDPPYGVDIGNQSQGKGGGVAKKIDYGKNDWDKNIPYPFLDIIKKMDSTKILWGANYYAEKLMPMASWLVWDKDNGASDFADCELAWVNTNKAARIFKWRWAGMLQEDMKNKEKRVHPTQKPIALAEWCFKNYGEPKTVLDLFLGSGSTLIACEKTGRYCRGMELDEHYMSVIIKRWEEYTGQKAERIE